MMDKIIIDLMYGIQDITMTNQIIVTYINILLFKKVDNFHRMLLAVVNDFRCVVIKLVERVTYLCKVKNTLENERVLIAKEYINIYTPLAHCLGIWQSKWELEDYCFRYLYPTEYKRVAKLLHERRTDREYYIQEFVSNLYKSIKKEGIRVKIYGRPKNIYSIWRKMQKKNLTFDELFDIRAVRIVADKLRDCYTTLRIIHSQFQHLPNEFDDYITNPKPNGYQSIHTVIFGPDNKTIEIQIRTEKMHEDAELGIAAHWKYKEGFFFNGTYFEYKNRITLLNNLVTVKKR